MKNCKHEYLPLATSEIEECHGFHSILTGTGEEVCHICGDTRDISECPHCQSDNLTKHDSGINFCHDCGEFDS
jgi:hypothetical protein